MWVNVGPKEIKFVFASTKTWIVFCDDDMTWSMFHNFLHHFLLQSSDSCVFLLWDYFLANWVFFFLLLLLRLYNFSSILSFSLFTQKLCFISRLKTLCMYSFGLKFLGIFDWSTTSVPMDQFKKYFGHLFPHIMSTNVPKENHFQLADEKLIYFLLIPCGQKYLG